MKALPLALLFGLLVISCGANDNGPGGDPSDSSGGAAAETGGTGGLASGGSGGDASSSGGTLPTDPPRWQVTGIATWRGDATGAYTLFHDDTCNESVDHQFEQADPALHDRGLVASFGAIAQDCLDRDLWDELELLISHGHEIANHSYSHPYLTDPDTDINQEVDQAHNTLQSNLPPGTVSYFIFPYDSFNDTLIDRLRTLGYLGARAGERGLNLANFPDDLRINFDAYGPGYSIYAGTLGTPCEGVQPGDDWDTAPELCRTYVMNQYVDDIISAGGYGIRELHSLDGEAWEPLPLSEYEAHLDYLVERANAGDLWVTTASDAIRYRRARDACADVIVSGDILFFDAVSDDCLHFATTLSYFIRPLGGSPVASLTASQGGQDMAVVVQGDGSYLVNANPTQGPLTLTAE